MIQFEELISVQTKKKKHQLDGIFNAYLPTFGWICMVNYIVGMFVPSPMDPMGIGLEPRKKKQNRRISSKRQCELPAVVSGLFIHGVCVGGVFWWGNICGLLFYFIWWVYNIYIYDFIYTWILYSTCLGNIHLFGYSDYLWRTMKILSKRIQESFFFQEFGGVFPFQC